MNDNVNQLRAQASNATTKRRPVKTTKFTENKELINTILSMKTEDVIAEFKNTARWGSVNMPLSYHIQDVVLFIQAVTQIPCGKVAQFAAVHDLAEIITGDVVAPIKLDLKARLPNYKESLLWSLQEELDDLFFKNEDDTLRKEVEYLVKLADTFSWHTELAYLLGVERSELTADNIKGVLLDNGITPHSDIDYSWYKGLGLDRDLVRAHLANDLWLPLRLGLEKIRRNYGFSSV